MKPRETHLDAHSVAFVSGCTDSSQSGAGCPGVPVLYHTLFHLWVPEPGHSVWCRTGAAERSWTWGRNSSTDLFLEVKSSFCNTWGVFTRNQTDWNRDGTTWNSDMPLTSNNCRYLICTHGYVTPSYVENLNCFNLIPRILTFSTNQLEGTIRWGFR